MVSCKCSWIIPILWTINFGYCFVIHKLNVDGSSLTYNDRGPPPGPSLATRLNTQQNSDIKYGSNNNNNQIQTLEYTRNLELEAEVSDQEVDINAFSTDVVNPNQKSRPDMNNSTDGDKKLPKALIIGAKKGGTRALLEFLRQHPDVRAPGPEIHFFDRHYDLGLDWYRQQMPATLPGQLTMEKTPCYFVTKDAPRKIFNMDKNIKLILVVRDPVTRAISDYTQSLSKRTAKKPFADLALLRNSTVVDGHWGAIRIGMYAVHLERWLRYFPMEQIHVVSGEKLISEPAKIMAGVQGFLGIKNIINEKHFFFNETKGFPCLKKGESSARPHCLGKTKGRQHPYIDPRVIVRLRQFFRPFNKKFEELTGMKFGWT